MIRRITNHVRASLHSRFRGQPFLRRQRQPHRHHIREKFETAPFLLRRSGQRDQSETQDYIHTESRQITRDAHPGNWIKQRGTAELMPVDISIEQF